jgi:phosphate transport system ATP-binding protein
VKDRLGDIAPGLPEGLQRRLGIARALAVDPQVLLLDEPAGGLDPVASAGIEELLRDLRRDLTLLMVTHRLQQAARIADFTAFLLGGELVEVDDTGRLFSRPGDPRTEEYLTGRHAG